jgi:hypothetical protein
MQKITEKDRQILRDLASRKAEIAELPVHKEKERLWRALNNLKPERPMVSIIQIPWHEMNVNDELTLQCQDEYCRNLETGLRRELYQWKYMPGDMMVSASIASPIAFHDSGIGIQEESDIARLDEETTAPSRHFHIQIQEEEDLEKIKMPCITPLPEKTEQNFETLSYLFEDILEVKKRGVGGFWFSPWDELVRWWGVQEVLTDLALRPDLVHKGMSRLVETYLCRLDQLIEHNLLSSNHHGSSSVDDLPGKNFTPEKVMPENMWCTGAAQIFSEVSPQMHEEFALEHEKRFHNRFGLVHYGCCEPLHNKVDISRKHLKTLRKISMSPWVDVEIGAKNVGTDLVFARRPNPSVLAGSHWDPEYAKKELTSCLEKVKPHGCPIEFIMKDISTVNYEPQRLWEWEKIAMNVVMNS